MKKRKTYEISVIDKTYSKTISDETKFYTSDTSLELVFKLKETEYTFESAEIVLLNIDDRSLVTRPVAKVLDSFAYELEDDIIAHYGEWRGQVRFEQAGEVYVSSPVKFRIENDLSNDRPPQLSDVQSWVSLKRYADGLVDELKQAVLSIEGVEDTFNTNELERQNQFTSAEQSRQTTFETNEIERNETFKINETTRQSQELERETAENARQTTFNNNEFIRTETFNANEATRQENETTRQQAESQRQSTFETNEEERQATFEDAEQERQSAEIIRVENENQREIDHANRSAELAGKANKKQEDWITPTLLGGATGNVQFRKNQFGRVEFKGIIKGTEGFSVFVLPIGYRPIEHFRTLARFNNPTNEARCVYFLSSGRVYLEQPYGTTEIYFDAISFNAE